MICRRRIRSFSHRTTKQKPLEIRIMKQTVGILCPWILVKLGFQWKACVKRIEVSEHDSLEEQRPREK